MGVKIRAIEIVNGENVVDNKFYANHFTKLGVNTVSRIEKEEEESNIKTRYIKNKDTSMLDMCVRVVKKLLEANNLIGEDIDLVILATATPEYTVPPTSLKILAEVGVKTTAACYDVNATCVGALHALKQVYSLFDLDSKLNKAIVVAYDDINSIIDKNNPLLYGCFGDTASAVLLERVEGSSSGYVDSMSYIHSDYVDYAKFPPHGNSLCNLESTCGEKYMHYELGRPQYASSSILDKLLKKNNMNIGEIKAFCIAQPGTSLIRLIEKEFNLASGTIPFYGTKYGYTGGSCTSVSLYEQIKEKHIKSGDLICFCGIGFGFQELTMLIRF